MRFEVIVIGLLVIGGLVLGLVAWLWMKKHRGGAPVMGVGVHNEPSLPVVPALPTPPTPPPIQLPELSPEERARLEQGASTAFEAAVQSATQRFGANLDETSKKLNELISRLTTDVVEKELEQYRGSLGEARKSALDALASMQSDIEQRQHSLQTEIDNEMAARRDYLLERLDKKLGEAVSAYLVESLGQGADLGAQRTYLLESLQRYKDDLKAEFGGAGNES